MDRDIKLSHLNEVLTEFDYPVSKADAAAASTDVELQLADGTVNMGEVIQESETTKFDSPDELNSEIMNHLPRRAVGEPYQSEGDA